MKPSFWFRLLVHAFLPFRTYALPVFSQLHCSTIIVVIFIKMGYMYLIFIVGAYLYTPSVLNCIFNSCADFTKFIKFGMLLTFESSYVQNHFVPWSSNLDVFTFVFLCFLFLNAQWSTNHLVLCNIIHFRCIISLMLCWITKHLQVVPFMCNCSSLSVHL